MRNRGGGRPLGCEPVSLFRRQDRPAVLLPGPRPRSHALDALAVGAPQIVVRYGTVRLVLTAHVNTLLDDIEWRHSAHLRSNRPPALRTAIVKKRDRYEQALRRVIAEGVRSGELVDMNPAVVTRAMLGAMNWTVTWFRPEGAHTASTVGDVISRFLVRGIASRTPAAKRTLSVMTSAQSKGPT